LVLLEGSVLNTRKFKKGIISGATEIWVFAEYTLMSDLQCQRYILRTIAELVNRLSAFPLTFCVVLMMVVTELRHNCGEWYVMGTVCTRAFIVIGTVCTRAFIVIGTVCIYCDRHSVHTCIYCDRHSVHTCIYCDRHSVHMCIYCDRHSVHMCIYCDRHSVLLL